MKPIEGHLELQLKYITGLQGQTFHLAFLFVCCATGALKEWSLVIYGTAEPPYRARHERARSAEMPVDDVLTEEYSGDSPPCLLFLRPHKAAKCMLM